MLTCNKCGKDSARLSWLREKDGWCSGCFHEGDPTNRSAMINTDDIPGGLEVKHGICNPDGSPRKYYSKSEIKRAAFEAGYNIVGDTPKPNQRIVEERRQQAEQRER